MDFDRISKYIKPLVIFLIILLIIYVFFLPKKNSISDEQPPIVEVANPKSEISAEYITQTGNTIAYNSVDLVARVKGYLESVNFIDGSFVEKGKLLFVIEPKPYLEQLKEAKASVSSQEAGLAYAEAEYARQQRMYKENATSLNSVEKWRAKRDEEKAQLLQTKANEVNAAINYSYTHINAPFYGRIGRHLVDSGNLVGNGEATKLATIEQIKPIYVYFNLNELDLIQLRNAMRAQGLSAKDIKKIPVEVGMQNQKDFPYKGKLDFVNTGLDASTGTMEFRALLANENYTFVPGLFVKVRVPITKPSPQLTVPDTAVQYDQIGPYLYLVNEKNYVKLQRVKLGSLNIDRRTILKGLKAKDWVIVNGLQNATENKLVTPKKKN